MLSLMFWKRVWAKVKFGWGPEVPEWAQGVTVLLSMLVVIMLLLALFSLAIGITDTGGSE